ncbi:GntR family transcriptional regulator [Pokkaliibacter plantistimulans]|uniref:GntR family transcriptional regulator n=1 Tax=Proteobacteria bacterium 228 TaxID=2083153 RepID=A0A2S5KI77_9PROT|nr:GntR family transcriptional regulator [Pokkaliibacter plantistimulans]PPC74345.1 GntR family transcriptional regulator [Pokkaliibacter plantistimulans]
MKEELVTSLIGHPEQLRDTATPLYLQLYTLISRTIQEGRLRAGEALPSERDIATQMEVSRVTVRRAIDRLVEDGICIQRQGAGTFVSERVEQPLNRLKSFTEVMQERGKVTHSRWLDRSLGIAHEDERRALQLAEGEEVVRFYRLRYANNQPMALEWAAVPCRFISNPFMVEDSLYRLMDQQGVRPVRALQRLRAVSIDAERANLLQISADSAVLYIERIGISGRDERVEFTRSWFPGDSYDFVAEIRDNAIDTVPQAGDESQ